MIFPTITDYISAVQISESFRNKSFLSPVLDANKLPIFIAGGPAVVFKMYDKNNPSRFYALKLFTKDVDNRDRNFAEIHKYKEKNNSSYLIDYEYIKEEIWVNDSEYPILLMNWIEGDTLSKYIQIQCQNNDVKALEALAGSFDAMSLWLLNESIAHGDLKPDNIIITPRGDLKLVDYDGMFVPSLEGSNALELGNSEYRHPKRTSKDFNSNIDDFPILVLSLSLHTLAKHPSIYEAQKGGDALLFRSQDYKQILSFPHFQYFQQNQEDEILFPRFSMLMYSISQPIIQLNGLTQILQKTAIENAEIIEVIATPPSNPTEKISTQSFPEEGEWIDEYGVKYTADKTKLIKAPRELKEYKIRDTCKVICDSAFAWCSSLKSIEIPDSVTSIGVKTFYRCESLKNIVIPDSVKSIGDSAFYNCSSLKSIVIPDSVTSIGNASFAWCSSLKSIEIPDSVKSIGNEAFIHCSSLKSIEIPDSVKSIGKEVFIHCSSLESIVIPDCVTSIGNASFDWCSSLKSIVIPNSVTSIGEAAFSSCYNLTEIKNHSINYILEDGFFISKEGSLIVCLKRYDKKIIIPQSVTRIGNCAFHNCSSLESIVIPDSVTSIGDWAFSHCTRLKSIVIPDSVTIIGDWAFSSCASLESIVIPNSVTSIGKRAFKSFTIHDSIFVDINNPYLVWKKGYGLEFPNGSSFFHVRIKITANPIIPEEGEWIDEYGVKYTADKTKLIKAPRELKEYKIRDTCKVICDNAFFGCKNLTTIIPNSVTSNRGSVFHVFRGITSLIIPNSVTNIGSYAFSYCTRLKSIEIPNSVTSIGYDAFDNCKRLKSIEIPNSVTSIGVKTFYRCESLKNIVIPDSVKSIGDSAFYNCSSLKSIVIPDSVTSIGNASFDWCSSLKSIEIPDSVKSIGNEAFNWCRSLKGIEIPDSVKRIGEAAFSRCYNLTEIKNHSINYILEDGFFISKEGLLIVCLKRYDKKIIIPQSVTRIGNCAFHNCSSLESIVIPDSVTSIGDWAFSDCTSLIIIDIPDSVTSIGKYAFDGCANLKSIEIPDSVKSIGSWAFDHCAVLDSIFVDSNNPYLVMKDGYGLEFPNGSSFFDERIKIKK